MSETTGIDQDHRELGELFARLIRIAEEIDPVPELVYELGYAAFRLRDVDAELIELVLDSATDSRSPVGVRSGGLTARLLSFEAANLEVDLQVVPQAARCSLLGQVVGTVTAVRVQTPEGVRTTTVDQHGRFQLDDIPTGRIRLHLDTAGGGYVTRWVTV